MRMSLAVILTVLACLAVATPALRADAQETDQRAAPRAPEMPPPPEPVVVPADERNRKNPLPPSPEVLERGQRIFASQCTMCHGSLGDGKGDLVDRLGLSVPDFTRPEVQAKRTDGELFYILGKGHGSMPGQEKRLKEEERWTLIHYLRSLQRS